MPFGQQINGEENYIRQIKKKKDQKLTSVLLTRDEVLLCEK